MLIKVCGITQNDQLHELDRLDAIDFIGTIYYEKSKRFVESILPATQKAKKVGVFVNENLDKIIEISEKQNISLVQLHGKESPEECAELSNKFTTIKAFGLSDRFDFKLLNAYQNSVDFFLFDTSTSDYGGSGRKFNWKILDGYQLSTPFFLSGGIQLSDALELKAINHPQFYGIDINSGFEIKPGIKNIELIKQFIDELFN